MRPIMQVALIVGAVTASAISILPARAQSTFLFCDAERRCVQATQQNYTACQNLAFQRGWNLSKTDYRGLNSFIYGCLNGRFR